MEGSVTIPIEEYELLTGIKKDFDEKLKSELKRMNEADRAFVLRDRDEYVRRNERLLKENSEKAEELRKVAEMNVRLRIELDGLKGKLETLAGIVAHSKWSEEESERELNEAKAEIGRRDENEKTLRETVNRLRKERADALNAVDQLKAEIVNLKGRIDAACHMDNVHVERLMGRGLLARVLNRRPW